MGGESAGVPEREGNHHKRKWKERERKGPLERKNQMTSGVG